MQLIASEGYAILLVTHVNEHNKHNAHVSSLLRTVFVDLRLSV